MNLNGTLDPGMLVTHRGYGEGEVLDEWGSWFSCRGCFAEIHRLQALCARCELRRDISEEEKTVAGPLHVSGHGIYNVLFRDGKIRAINKAWLPRAVQAEVAA